MTYCIQYQKSDGFIIARVRGDASDEQLPEHMAQLKFAEWVNDTGKMVDLETLQLVDAPPPVEE